MAIGIGVRDFAFPTIDRRMIIGGILAAVTAHMCRYGRGTSAPGVDGMCLDLTA